MMKSGSGFAAKGMERILELSARAQINRREVAKDSPALQNFTGAIAACGKVLALLTEQNGCRLNLSPLEGLL